MIRFFSGVYLKILFRITFAYLLFSIGLDLKRSYTYCTTPTKVNYVYRTISDLILNQPSQYVYFNKIIYKSKVNLVFLSDMEGKIQIIDTNQKNKIITEFKIDICISGFILSSDGKKIICYSKQKFSSFLITDMKNGIIEKQFEQSVISPNQIIQVLVDEKEEYLFLATTDGYIKVFTNNNYIKIVQIYQYLYSRSSFVGFKLSHNKNYIIIDQDYQGLHILKLTWNKNTKEQVNIVKAGSFEQQTSYDSYIFSDEKTIISLDYWSGVQIGSIEQLEKVNPSQYPIQLKYDLEQWWQFNDPMPYCLTVDEGKRILFVGSRSQGIFIIDINNLSNPILIQNINIPSYAMSIQVSSDIQYIYYTNRQQFFIFSLTQPLFQDEYLHFFNDHQSNLTEVENTRWLWRCYVEYNDHYLFSASDVNGLQIYDIQKGPNEMQLLFSIDNNTEYLQIDDIVLLQGQTYLVIPYSSKEKKTIFRVYDIRDLNNIKEVSNVQYDRVRSVSQMSLGVNNRYMVSTYEQSIIILDCYDFLPEQNDLPLKEIKVVGEYEFFEVNKDMTSDVTFILDDKYVVVCFSYFGITLVKITPSETLPNMLDLRVIQVLETYGGESIVLSKKYQNRGFISDGLNGILIVEFETSTPDFAYIQLVSRLRMIGWVNQITLVNDETQVVAASIDGGYITIIDIHDIRNPFIVTEFTFREKYNFSSCKSKDYFFLNTEKGIRGFLMKKQSLIHTDIAQFIPDKGIYNPITRADSYKIGQTIVMNFQLIFPQNGQKIQNVFYYKDRQKLPLPNWMNFNQQNKQLTIKVNRDGLYSSQNSMKQNILVVLSIFSLNQYSFVYDKNKINENIDNEFVQTTQEESTLIYEYLKKTGYINWKTGIVNPVMIQDNQLYFEIEGVQINERLCKAVTHTLQQSYTFNPIYFNIQSSLRFNLSPQNSTYISSLSNIVSITLSFYIKIINSDNVDAEVFNEYVGIPGGAVFINQIKTFTTGLSLTISKGGTILKTEGPPSKINEFLESKIVYWYQNPTDLQINQQNFTVPNNLFVVILVQDLINYDLLLIYPLKGVPFLKLKGPISQNSENKIQDQFNREYTDGIVYITHSIDIQFERESFYDNDQLSITYSATLEDGSEIPPDYWLQFQPSVMRLYGIVPRSAFRQTITLKIVAKNNYTIYWNELKIHAYNVPFLFVFSLIAQIISPILFLIGLYRFKYILYNIFLRHRNRYSDEICYINQPYRKKIPLIGENLQIAKFLVDGLKTIASIEQNGIQKRIRENSRKLTRTMNRTSPYLIAPDNQNINIMNLSSNTNALPKDINSPQFNVSRQQLKSPKHPISITSRRRSLFLQEHIKHTSFKIVNTSKQKTQEDNENKQPSNNHLENPDQNIQKYNNSKVEITQIKSLPYIIDKDNKIQNKEHLNDAIINDNDQNLNTERLEQYHHHNISINDQFQNTSQSKQEQQNNMNSILVTSGVQSSPKSSNQTNYQESLQQPDKITFNLNINSEEKDFIIQDQDFTTNSHQLQYENTQQIKIQLNLSTNKTLQQIYEISKQNSHIKTKDSFSRSHFSPIKGKKENSENNQYQKKGTLENNQDIMKEEQSNSIKQSNIPGFSQIQEEQVEKDQSHGIANSNATGQTNKLSIQKNINGFLTPYTEHSQNWGQETNRAFPIKRQMSITPMGAEFKRQVNTLKNLQKKNQRQQRTVFEVKYMDENGYVSMESVITDIIQQNSSFVVKMKKYQASDFILELKNKDSILFNYIRALIARHLLSLDRQSTLLYNILKTYAQQNFSFSANDWYKAYVDINAQQESDIHGFQICFPRLQINSSQISRVIRSLLLFEPNNFDDQSCNEEDFPQPMTGTQRMLPLQNSVSQQNQPIFPSQSQLNFNSKNPNFNNGFNQALIEEVIIADALGFITKTPSQRFPSVGESLHIRGYKVDSVEAFSITKRDTNFCSKLREVFGLDYHRYGSSQNIKLPSWVNFYQKQNLIFLEGTPSSHDIEEILIRIYNSKRYIIKEFILKITNEFNLFESQKPQGIQYTKKYSDDFKVNQPRKTSDSRRISDDRSFLYNQETNRSPKMSSISSNNNIFYQNKNNQFKQTKSITNIQQPFNDPLSSPSSISHISITSQNRLQLQSEEDNKYTSEQTTSRVPQTSDNHRFIQDINPFSANNIPLFSSLKKPYLNKESSKHNN